VAKSTKKKSSAKKPAARKARTTHKDRLKRPVSKKVAKTTKAGKRLSPNKTTTESPAVFLGLNHRERRLDPFIRHQKAKLPHLRDSMADSMTGVAQAHLPSRAAGCEPSSFCMHPGHAGSAASYTD